MQQPGAIPYGVQPGAMMPYGAPGMMPLPPPAVRNSRLSCATTATPNPNPNPNKPAHSHSCPRGCSQEETPGSWPSVNRWSLVAAIGAVGAGAYYAYHKWMAGPEGPPKEAEEEAAAEAAALEEKKKGEKKPGAATKPWDMTPEESLLKEVKDIKRSLNETKAEQEDRLRRLESASEHQKGVQEAERNRALVNAVESAMSKNSDSATRNVEALCGEFRDLKRALSQSQDRPLSESLSRTESDLDRQAGSSTGGSVGGETERTASDLNRAKSLPVNNKPFSTAPGRKGADLVSKAYGKPRSRPHTPSNPSSRPETPTEAQALRPPTPQGGQLAEEANGEAETLVRAGGSPLPLRSHY